MGVRLLGKTGRLTTGTTLGSAVGTDEEDKNKQQQTTTGEAAFGGGGGAVKPVTQQAAPQTKGSGFTNVQKILRASGTDTGPSRLAQTAAGGVRQAASSAQQALTGAVEKFGKETSESVKAVPTSTDIGSIIGRATGTGATTPGLGAGDVQKWQQATSGAYGGPTSLQMTPEQQREAAKSSALSRLAGDVSGRSALLQKYVGSPQYGQSKQTLDTLLLGRGGSAALRGALRQGARTEQDIKRQEIVAQEQAKQAQERARGIAEEAKTGLEQAKTGLMSRLETKKQEQAEQISSAVDRVLSSLAYKYGTQPTAISKKDLSILGLTENDLTNLGTLSTFGIDPRKYLKGKTSQELSDYLKKLGKEQFATTEEQAQLAALGQLVNQENLGLTNLGAVYNLQGLSRIDIAGLKKDYYNKLNSLLGAPKSEAPFDIANVSNISEFMYDVGKPNYESSVNTINQNIENYMSGKISKDDLFNLDPIFSLAKTQIAKLEKQKDTKETRGFIESGLNHWNNVLYKRANQLKYLTYGKPSFVIND